MSSCRWCHWFILVLDLPVSMDLGCMIFLSPDTIFASNTAEKMKFSIKDFFSKCDQIRGFLRSFFVCNVINLIRTSVVKRLHCKVSHTENMTH